MRPVAPVLTSLAAFTGWLFSVAPCAGQDAPTATDRAVQLVRDLVGANETRRTRAEVALRDLRAAGVEALLRHLRREPDDSEESRRILTLIGRLGRDATAALPTLLERMRETKRILLYLEPIDKIAPYAPERHDDVVDALAKAWIGFGRPRGQKRAVPNADIARSKSRLELDRETPTKELLAKLLTGHTVHRELAAELLVTSTGDTEKKLVALRKCLARPRKRYERITAQFRTAAVHGALGTSVDNRAKERLSISWAIVQLSKTKDVPPAAWVNLLEHDDRSFVRRAIQAIGASPDPAAVKGLIDIATSSQRTLAWEAITTLGMLGPLATEAIRDLERLATHEDKGTSVRAKAALRAIERK